MRRSLLEAFVLLGGMEAEAHKAMAATVLALAEEGFLTMHDRGGRYVLRRTYKPASEARHTEVLTALFGEPNVREKLVLDGKNFTKPIALDLMQKIHQRLIEEGLIRQQRPVVVVWWLRALFAIVWTISLCVAFVQDPLLNRFFLTLTGGAVIYCIVLALWLDTLRHKRLLLTSEGRKKARKLKEWCQPTRKDKYGLRACRLYLPPGIKHPGWWDGEWRLPAITNQGQIRGTLRTITSLLAASFDQRPIAKK